MDIEIDDKTFEPFINCSMIEKRIRLMGIQINVDYREKVPVFIGVLNGGFLFMADLLREVTISCETAFIKLSSYHGGTESTGEITEEFPLHFDIENRDVIIVEDIVDTGHTLNYLLNSFKSKKPASVKVATLLLKPAALKYEFSEIDLIGFEIANDFVVGYGLDYKGLGRNLRDIYRLKG